jgi:hypothetical protein
MSTGYTTTLLAGGRPQPGGSALWRTPQRHTSSPPDTNPEPQPETCAGTHVEGEATLQCYGGRDVPGGGRECPDTRVRLDPLASGAPVTLNHHPGASARLENDSGFRCENVGEVAVRRKKCPDVGALRSHTQLGLLALLAIPVEAHGPCALRRQPDREVRPAEGVTLGKSA